MKWKVLVEFFGKKPNGEEWLFKPGATVTSEQIHGETLDSAIGMGWLDIKIVPEIPTPKEEGK